MISRIVKYFIAKLTSYLRAIKGRKGEDCYISMISPNAPWVYVSYISNVFFHLHDDRRLNSHQNQREAIVIVETFNALGYNVYVVDYNSKRSLPNINVEIVFGLEPLFALACEKYGTAKKIYYATGAYYKHQNKMVKYMTDMFNVKFNSRIPYRRLVASHNSCELSDYILQIGSDFTIETYPIELRHKISKIRQSVQYQSKILPIEFARENEFVFMGSVGNALKGIGSLICYFSDHKDYIIHIIGPMEQDVLEALRPTLTSNILFHGFMDVNSEDYLQILKKCNFLIYPSGSEGSPGAVLNLMRNGMIPLVSRWAAFDEIENYGFLLDNVDEESIGKAINWAISQSETDILRMKKKASNYVKNNFSLNFFSCNFKSYIESIIMETGVRS